MPQDPRLNELVIELAKLLGHNEAPTPDRYDEGYTAGYHACHQELQRRIREVLKATFDHSFTPNHEAVNVAPTPQRKKKGGYPWPGDDRWLGTPGTKLYTKLKELLDYLLANPGARYKDMVRDLSEAHAQSAPTLIRRGFARKDGEARYHLINPPPHNEGRKYAN